MNSINPNKIGENLIDLISNQWMLITSGTKENWNTMTASWGGMGYIWEKPTSMCVLRPQRYTTEFMNKNDFYTLTFFPETEKKKLQILGTKSGRNINKMQDSGLTPIYSDNYVYFEEAKITLICKKLYYQDLEPQNFNDPKLAEKMYPQKDFHRMFFGEIVECLVK